MAATFTFLPRKPAIGAQARFVAPSPTVSAQPRPAASLSAAAALDPPRTNTVELRALSPLRAARLAVARGTVGLRVAHRATRLSITAKRRARHPRSVKPPKLTDQEVKKASVPHNNAVPAPPPAEVERYLKMKNLISPEEYSEAPKVGPSFRCLILDVSYTPVDIISWQRGIVLDLLDKVEVLEYYDMNVKTVRDEYPIPAVVKVNVFVANRLRQRKRHTINRRSIMMRDRWECQYCSCKENLTIDHLIPLSRGGPWSWDNLVTACSKCNSRKGSKTPEAVGLRLHRQPVEPPPTSYGYYLRHLDVNRCPEPWRPYLPQQRQQQHVA